MRNMSEDIRDTNLLEKILISLTPEFESKKISIKEKQDLHTLTVVQLHWTLTAFEMIKGGSSKVKEDVFRAAAKGKEVEEQKGSRYVSEEDEINFVKKL